MAAVAGLVRGPLRQVGSGPWRARRRLCALSEPFYFSLSLCQASGLLKRRFHRSAPAAVQVTGPYAGQGREGVLGPGSRPERSGSRLLQGWVASRTLAAAASCV